MAYTDSFEFVPVYWDGYFDPESSVVMYQIRLLSLPSCREEDEALLGTVVDWIDMDANYTSYKFMDLDLQVSLSFYRINGQWGVKRVKI